MKRLRWIAERLGQQFGVAGLLGFTVLLGCAAFASLDVAGTQRDAASLTIRTQELNARNADPALGQSAPLSTEQSLTHIYSALPRLQQLDAILASIVAIGGRQGLAVSAGEFKLVSDNASPIVRYQIVFPLQGSYRAMREFVREAMRASPSLALEQITFRRDNASSAQIESRVQMALYLLNPDSPGSP
jgi:hypothetical protein